MNTIRIAALSATSLTLALAGCNGGDGIDSSAPLINQQVACSTLQGIAIPASSIGLPTRGAVILAATDTTDTDSAGAARSYCMVTGNILSVDPSAMPIRFQVNLPRTWNRHALQFGGGGTNGTVVTGLTGFSGAPATLPTPLAKGYATFGSDSGHDATGLPPFDTSFALNQEQLMNFAQQQVKKTVDVAKALVAQMYGSTPRYTYFAGGSQGGHEAFDAAQRYPGDYDGVIAHYPAYNLQNIWLGAQGQAQAIYGKKLLVPSLSWSNPTKIANLVAAVVKACDALDGVADGIIGNVPACNATYTMDTVKATMRCPNGADTGNDCFSDAQLAAIAKIDAPVQLSFALAGGSTSYPKWPILEGATFLSNHLGRTNTADLSKFPFGPDGSAFQLFPAKGMVQGFITRDLTADPLAFDPNQWVARIQEVSGWTDAVDTDLSRFAAKGGKMILTHGTIDDSITPHNTIAYWNKLVTRNGQAAVDGFARFYLIAGMGHGSGVFTAQADYLSVLEAWVERGEVPGRIVARDGNTTAASAATNGRTRPLCLYGTYARYTGPSSPTQAQANDAANFTCTPS